MEILMIMMYEDWDLNSEQSGQLINGEWLSLEYVKGSKNLAIYLLIWK